MPDVECKLAGLCADQQGDFTANPELTCQLPDGGVLAIVDGGIKQQ
ncbi:MAG: hypothetical protein IPJ65_42065 [Archangiaceae bacterium]|nr:hypothetical protein [Archangiaceae bacterium]